MDGSWSKKHLNEIAREKKKARRESLFAVGGILAGVVLTSVFNQWIAPHLPGPAVDASVLTVTPGNGCTAYLMVMATDGPIDTLHARAVLPQNISQIRFGSPGGGISDAGAISAALAEFGKDDSGKCRFATIVDVSDSRIGAVQSANVLTVWASQLGKDEQVFATAVVDDDDRATQSKEPRFEGDFAFTNWGISIRKKITYHPPDSAPPKK